jgi:hypothetical protein
MGRGRGRAGDSLEEGRKPEVGRCPVYFEGC